MSIELSVRKDTNASQFEYGVIMTGALRIGNGRGRLVVGCRGIINSKGASSATSSSRSSSSSLLPQLTPPLHTFPHRCVVPPPRDV